MGVVRVIVFVPEAVRALAERTGGFAKVPFCSKEIVNVSGEPVGAAVVVKRLALIWNLSRVSSFVPVLVIS